MVFGKQMASLGVVALTMLVVPAGVALRGQQQSPQGATGATGTQGIPDAPKPQALPTLNTITPVGSALPNFPAKAPVASPNEVGSTLPSTPAPGSQSVGQDDGPPPELPEQGKGVDAMKPLIVNVNFVQIPFTVKDSKGKLVPGLTWRDVRIYENGQRQQMKVFTADPFPLTVALVIDQSVTFDTMDKINRALGALQGAFTSYDEVAIFTYNSSVRQQTDFLAAQSARLGVILDRSKGKGNEPVMGLDGPLAQGIVKNNENLDPNTSGTSANQGIAIGAGSAPKEFHTLNDAILAAAQATSHAAKGRRRIVYIISDGKEYGSQAKEKDVIKYCQRNKISVYGTVVGDTAVPGVGFLDSMHLPFTMRENALRRYASATGGELDPEFREKGIENSFAKITEEVRTQYTVGYYTHLSPLNEEKRKWEVQVMRPNLTVIAPEGYYATANDTKPAPVTPMATP